MRKSSSDRMQEKLHLMKYCVDICGSMDVEQRGRVDVMPPRTLRARVDCVFAVSNLTSLNVHTRHQRDLR